MILYSCGKKYTPEQEKYVKEIEKSRAEKDDWMKNNAGSPFVRDPNAHYAPLKYYDVGFCLSQQALLL